MGQRNQAMKPEVGHFGDDGCGISPVVRVLGGHHHFGGFFADFFQKGVWPLGQ